MAVVSYERRRIRTVRSTWVILLITLLLTAAVGALIISVGKLDPETGDILGNLTTLELLNGVFASGSQLLILVPLATLAAMAFGGEYRFGLIRTTLTAFPRRSGVFLAKFWVVSVYLVVFLLLCVALVLAAGQFVPSRVDAAIDPLPMLGFVGRFLAFGLMFCMFAFALAVITRMQALAIIIPVLWALIVEGVLSGILASKFEWLPKVLPITAGSNFVAAGEEWQQGGLVMLAWVVVFMLIAWLLLLRRDA